MARSLAADSWPAFSSCSVAIRASTRTRLAALREPAHAMAMAPYPACPLAGSIPTSARSGAILRATQANRVEFS
jgi:hypothetical protein